MKKMPTNAELSLLEKVVINVTTAFDVFVLWNMLSGPLGYGDTDIFRFEKHYELRVADYKRLVNYFDTYGILSKEALKIYNGSPCGDIMMLTCRLLREPPK